MTESLTFGFGSRVQTTIHGTPVTGEITATGADNRDMDDNQYILSIGDARRYELVESEEIVYGQDIEQVMEK